MKWKLSNILMRAVAVVCFLKAPAVYADFTVDDQIADKLKLTRIEDYLYSIEYEDYSYEDAYEFMDEYYMPSGCAAVSNNGITGRNFDWYDDEMAYFVIRTAAKDGRHATIGITGARDELAADYVDSRQWSYEYDILPFYTLDGVNDAGLFCCDLIVPNSEYGITYETNPTGETLNANMLVRYLLDYADSVDSAIEMIKEKNICMPMASFYKQQLHFMIADKEKTVIVEFIEDEVIVLEDENVVTNFYLTDFDKTQQELPRYPEGIERYNILKNGYDTSDTVEGMMKLMQSINYSQTYDISMVPFWYSEYCGYYDSVTLDSSNFGDPDLSDGDFSKAGDYQSCIEDTLGTAQNSGRRWITNYTSVYDLEKQTMSVCACEGTTVHEISLNRE